MGESKLLRYAKGERCRDNKNRLYFVFKVRIHVKISLGVNSFLFSYEKYKNS